MKKRLSTLFLFILWIGVLASILIPRITYCKPQKAKINDLIGSALITKITKITDGDTFRATINIGFDILLTDQRIRLYGIDTPEIRGERKKQGLKAQKRLKWYLVDYGQEVRMVLAKKQRDKYGRRLGRIFVKNKRGGWIDVNESMINDGMAIPRTK